MAVTSIDTDFFIRRPPEAPRGAAPRERFALASAEREHPRVAERRPDPSARPRASATVERDRREPEQGAARAERLGLARESTSNDRRVESEARERPRTTGPDDASRNARASDRDGTVPPRGGPDDPKNAAGTTEEAAAADASRVEEPGEAAEETLDETFDDPTAQPASIHTGLAIPPVAARREGGEPGSQDGDEPGAARKLSTAGPTTGGADAAAAGAVTAPDAANPSFEALLASTATTANEPATSTAAGPAAVAATAPASATSAAGAPPPQAPATPPIPLGAVPMTIGLRSLGGSSRFEIRLDPVDLGRIDVALDIDSERGTVTTHLVVERPETLALLQRDAGTLQQALSQAGLDPSEGGINLSLRGENGSGGQGADGQRSDARPDGSPAEPGHAQSQTDAIPLRSLRGLSGIDIRI